MTSHPLEIVHTDLCGSTRTKIPQGEYYFMLLIDDYTRMIGLTFLKEKSESFEKVKIFKAMVENQTHVKIKCLRSDNGEDLIQMSSMSFVRQMELRDNFQLQKLLSRMGKEKQNSPRSCQNYAQ